MTSWKRTLFSSGGGGETTWGVQLRNTAGVNTTDRMGLALGDDGSVYITDGFISGFGNANYGTNVIKVDTDGYFQWSRRLSISGANSPYATHAIILDGNPVVFGGIQDNLIGTGQEGVAMKLSASNGTTSWAYHYGKSGNTYSDSFGGGQAGGAQSGNIGLFMMNGNQKQLLMVRYNNSGAIQSSNKATYSRNIYMPHAGIGPSDAIFASGYVETSSPSQTGNFTVFNSTASSVTWNAGVRLSSSSYYAEGHSGCMDSSGNGYHTGNVGGSGLAGTYMVKFPSGGGSLSWSNCYYEVPGGQPKMNTRMLTDDTSVFVGGYGGDVNTGVAGAWLSYATSDGSLNYHKLLRMDGTYAWVKDMVLSDTGYLYLLGVDYSTSSPRGYFVMKVSVDGIDNGSYGDFDITDATRYNTTTPIYNVGYTPSIESEGMTDKSTSSIDNNASTGTWTETLESFDS